MCIAVYIPKEKHLTSKIIHTCWKNNSDGAGFMYIKNGSLVVEKNLFSVTDFCRKYKRAKKLAPNSDFVMHFRWATHGLINYNNCHPILTKSKEVGFVHNGILRDMPEHEIKSDTVMFSDLIISKLPKGFINNKILLLMLEKYIGYYNKLILMDVNGSVAIVNEEEGIWHDGCWFSNDDFSEERVKRTYFKGDLKGIAEQYVKSYSEHSQI